MRFDPRLRRSMTAAIVGAFGLLTLSSCVLAPSTPLTSAQPSSAPTVSGAPVELLSRGSAVDNLPFFDSVVRGAAGAGGGASGRAYIDALVTAGFDRSTMQLTPDVTTIGNPAESVEFSVRWGEDCLVGQVGPAIGDPVTTVLPGLADGGCLVGTTRAIDW